MEYLQLNRPENQIRHSRKGKRELEAYVPAKRRLTSMQRDRPDKPYLAHAEHHACNTAAECCNGSNARGQFVWLVVPFWVVTAETALEDKMIGERDTFVDCEPIP